ncbi:MAG TPA: hypothetical protein VF923_07585 [Gemmatimonadales bacterium]
MSAATLAPVAPGTAITLDQRNGTLNEQNVSIIAKGFNPRNPHVGDAIVATFFWTGPATITGVSDFITDAFHTPVGNTYRLVESTTMGGVSMASYVATNVQGFADPNPDPSVVLGVQATMSQPVPDGGMMISAFTGVDAVTSQPIAAHHSASGGGSVPTVADPGAVTAGVGALAYGVTMSGSVVGLDQPIGYTNLTNMSDASMKADGEYAVFPNGGPTDPRWTWYFSAAGSWLASALTLNPPPHLVFTQQPATTLPLTTMQPVRVTVTDASGNPVTTFTGTVTIAIGHNGGLVVPGTLSGTKTVAVVNGVATFSDLSIDQPGNGYTFVVTTGGVVGAESTPFNIGAF